MSLEPLDNDGTLRLLSPSERLTALLAGQSQATDPDLRLAFLGAARAVYTRLAADLESTRLALVAAEQEAARLAKGAGK